MTTQMPEFFDQPAENNPPDIQKIREAGEMIAQNLPAMMEQINHLSGLAYRTPDEEKLLSELMETCRTVLPYVRYIQEFLGDRMYKQTTAMYYRAKEMAEQGDPVAQKIVDDLKPLYEETLRGQLGNN